MNTKVPTFDSDRSRSWNAGMSARPGELDLSIAASEIRGSIPAALRGGRMLSNGPGWTQIDGWTAHPFDGHGYLRAFELDESGGCRLRARFIATASYEEEAAAERFVRRGLGTNRPGGSWRNLGLGQPRNVANTTVTRWAGRLLAGWEGGEPHALDPDSLATRGVETFDGAIAGQMTLAHMRHDHEHERLVLCSLATGKNTTLTFRELDRDSEVVSTRVGAMEGMMFAHDFAFSPSFYIVGGNPLRFKPKELAKMVLGRSTMLRAIATNAGKPGQLHLIPRDSQGPVRTITLPRGAFVIHFGNAFERDDGTVVVDACMFEDFEFGEEFGYTGPRTPFDPTLPDTRAPQRLVRIEIPPGATKGSCRTLSPHGVDFPRFHPEHEGRETPRLFGATRADTRHSDPFDSITAIDLRDLERPPSLWTVPGQHVFVGEPVFAPDPEHDDRGHVLALLSDGLRARTTLAIFAAQDLEAGPLAEIPMPLLPIAFHGDWDPRPG